MAVRQLEREQRQDKAGCGGAREGTLIHKPLDFEKRHGFPQLSPFMDHQLCHRAKIIVELHLPTAVHTHLEDKKSNVQLKTSFSCGLTLTVH